MNYEIIKETREERIVSVTMHYPLALIEEEVDKIVLHRGRTLTIPGFRLGKAPLAVLKRNMDVASLQKNCIHVACHDIIDDYLSDKDYTFFASTHTDQITAGQLEVEFNGYLLPPQPITELPPISVQLSLISLESVMKDRVARATDLVPSEVEVDQETMIEVQINRNGKFDRIVDIKATETDPFLAAIFQKALGHYQGDFIEFTEGKDQISVELFETYVKVARDDQEAILRADAAVQGMPYEEYLDELNQVVAFTNEQIRERAILAHLLKVVTTTGEERADEHIKYLLKIFPNHLSNEEEAAIYSRFMASYHYLFDLFSLTKAAGSEKRRHSVSDLKKIQEQHMVMFPALAQEYLHNSALLNVESVEDEHTNKEDEE